VYPTRAVQRGIGRSEGVIGNGDATGSCAPKSASTPPSAARMPYDGAAVFVSLELRMALAHCASPPP
jgi:hypothetical protein